MDKKIQGGYEIGQWIGEVCITWIGVLILMLIFSLPLWVIR